MSAHHIDAWQREQEGKDSRSTEPPASIGLRRDFGAPGKWARCKHVPDHHPLSHIPARCRRCGAVVTWDGLAEVVQ